MNEEAAQTILDCELDLELSYNRSASKRFLDVCIDKECFIGRNLTRQEILNEYKRIDSEFFSMLMSCRKGR